MKYISYADVKMTVEKEVVENPSKEVQDAVYHNLRLDGVMDFANLKLPYKLASCGIEILELKEVEETKTPDLVTCQHCEGGYKDGEKCSTCWGTSLVSEGEPGSEPL